jgi:hypothetical protein
MGFKIEFGKAPSDYTPFEGGGSDLFNFEGSVEAEITNVVEGKAKSSGNDMLTFTYVATDADCKGQRLVKSVPCSGMRSDDKPNVLGLLDVLNSVYSATEATDEAALAKVRALAGKGLGSDKLITVLKGKKVFLEIHAREYEADSGNMIWSSDVRNHITRGKHEANKSIGAHRRPLPAAARDAQGSTSTPVNGATTSASAPQSSASAEDALGIV